MLVLGLTGSIGTGKSTISNFFKEKGINIVDADKIARESTTKGSKGLESLVLEFGIEILTKEGDLDRSKLRDIIFADEKALIKVNSILHPIIIDMIKECITKYKIKNEKLIVLDAPLLIETKLNSLVDKIVLVYCNQEIQIQRIIKRDGIDTKKAMSIIKKQMSQDEKKIYSDFIIDNSSTLEDLKREFEKFYKGLEDWLEK